MSLAVGTLIGSYEVVAPLGEGGMGQVWKARDLRLGRDVALKVLPEAFAADPDRLARFERESQILAALNHPHIATIHGIEETPFGRALVMEFIAGPTLEARLAAAQMQVPEVLALARDLASGLEAAHDRGIIHRDLKPANLILTADERVKILDFGLAKAGPPDGTAPARSPTSIDTTVAGMLVGTAAYMSPEQARGAAVDRRTDIWAFGCVLFELLTRRPAFAGDSVSDVLAAILTKDPDWAALPANTPPAIRTLLDRCLRKDPRHRLRDAGDVRLVLEDVIGGRSSDVPPVAAPARLAYYRRWWPWAIGALIAIAAAAAGMLAGRASHVVPLRKLEITIHDPVLDVFTRPRISPDGNAIVYGSADRLWIRHLDQLEPLEVPGSRGGEAPFWSADGRSVAFVKTRKLWRVDARGGEPVAVCDLPSTGRIISGAWRDDGMIVFAAWEDSIYEVPARGGDPKVLLAVDSRTEVDFHELCALPSNRGLMFVRHERVGELQHIEVLAGGRRAILLRAQGTVRFDNPRYVPEGYLVYERLESNAGVWAVPFSLRTLTITGEPFRIAPGAAMPGVAADGTLIYTEESVSYELTWVNRSGQRVGTVGAAQPELQMPALSPDGSRIVVAAADPSNSQDRDLWSYDVVSGRRARLLPAPTPTRDMLPTWAPDGRTIVYVQGRRNPAMIVAVRLDRADVAHDVTPGFGHVSLSRDGRYMVYTRVSDRGRSELWWADVSTGFARIDPKLFVTTVSNIAGARFSPDGRFVAYASDESGPNEVYLRRFPGGDARWHLSVEGGSNPVWNGDGTELFYRAPDGGIMAVGLTLGADVQVDAPRRLFDEETSGVVSARGWDVTPDGQRFLMVRRSEAGRSGHVIVVQNWLAEFRK